MAQSTSLDRDLQTSRDLRDRPAPDLVTEVPGPKARAHVAFDEQWTSPSLPRAYPFAPVRGHGMAVEDVDGNVFLDFAAGIAVNSTGHAHPRVLGAIKEQAAELIHYSASDFYLPIYAETAREIARISGMSGRLRTYLGNSGTEVVEVAMKLARHHTRRPYIVGFLGGFHGRTYGAVSLTASKAKYHAGFEPLLPGIYHAPFGHVEDLKWFDDVLFNNLIPAEEVAAIVVEPIQGEGGYIVPEDGFLQGLRELCTKHGILLVADEIQSGAGRTGKMWAIEHWGVEPDILLVAKGIASGMPLAAMVTRAEIMESWSIGAHGSTYGGNPVACAAALATIELLEGGLVENAGIRGEELLAGLRELQARFPKSVIDIRGKGLMIGVEFADPKLAEEVQFAAFKRGLLVLECGKQTVRMCPPLIATADDVTTGLRIFGEAVEAVATHPSEIARQARAAAALHDGEVDA
ncbi:MAG TPA: aminotransferase class III-fold pyridoxal phosphate-dependent enzyme [Candidatus Limnocylindrales bacterium]|nr:aminotransferase class III-fold pyridoxal phosphate-dependent enzyme [Candidatus Limnocylindrales bacterium]